jgi:hypothetical protein
MCVNIQTYKCNSVHANTCRHKRDCTGKGGEGEDEDREEEGGEKGSMEAGCAQQH